MSRVPVVAALVVEIAVVPVVVDVSWRKLPLRIVPLPEPVEVETPRGLRCDGCCSGMCFFVGAQGPNHHVAGECMRFVA